jgi:serine/threonine protein kinase
MQVHRAIDPTWEERGRRGAGQGASGEEHGAIPHEMPLLALRDNLSPLIPGYEIEEELGRGGMAVVYKARQLALNRVVAVKVFMSAEHAGTRETSRFRREAEMVAQLQHPNIVQVYEVGEQNGRPYFSMEYVAGGSLDRHIKGTPQPAREAAQLVEALARTMHHAHERGIIHRDLKPANILLQRDEGGRMKDESRPDAPSVSFLRSLISAWPSCYEPMRPVRLRVAIYWEHRVTWLRSKLKAGRA